MKKQLILFFLPIMFSSFVIPVKSSAALVCLFPNCVQPSYCGAPGFIDPPQCQLSKATTRECDSNLDFIGWSDCENGKKRRQLSPNANCYPVNLGITDNCKTECTENDYVYSDWWGDCVNGVQTRNYKKINDCEGGIAPQISRICSVPKETCSIFNYSDWSKCVNGQQTRNIISYYPENCINGQPVITESCANDNIVISNNKSSLTENNLNISNFIETERSLVSKKDNQLVNKLKGKILLQVENKGEAWYVNPIDGKKIYMASGEEAYNLMRNKGVGISNKNLERINNDKTFAKKNGGKIFLQVEAKGEAYYVDFNGLAHYLKNGDAAYEVMRNLGLGISNRDIRKIEVSI